MLVLDDIWSSEGPCSEQVIPNLIWFSHRMGQRPWAVIEETCAWVKPFPLHVDLLPFWLGGDCAYVELSLLGGFLFLFCF